MNVNTKRPPRRFRAGTVELADCGTIDLAPDEQVTLRAADGEYDVVRKSWGFYATPSLNHRLPRAGLRPVLIRNRDGRFFVVLVERDADREFARYLEDERLEVAAWLDDESVLAGIGEAATSKPVT